ncbi:MAG: hypothetical protein WDM79_03190 [Terricaulis sp.]
MDKFDLKRWQKWGLAGLFIGLGVVRLFDDRGSSTTKLDDLEYANLALEFSIHFLTVLLIFNANRFFEWLFGLLAKALIKNGVAIAVPVPAPIPVPPVVNEDEPPEARTAREIAHSRRERDRAERQAKRTQLQQQMMEFGIGCLAPAAALIIGVGLMVLLFGRLSSGDAPAPQREEPKVEEREGAAQPTANEVAAPSCMPEYCTATDENVECALPSGGNPTFVARALLPSTASNVDIARLASQIWADNQNNPNLRNRSDRQIPANTTLRIRSSTLQCEDEPTDSGSRSARPG